MLFLSDVESGIIIIYKSSDDSIVETIDITDGTKVSGSGTNQNTINPEIDFAELCITSKFLVKESKEDEIVVKTKKAEGNKCPICWKIALDACESHLCPIGKH